jgi:molecular chaperone DnaK
VHAKDKKTGKEQKVEIKAGSGLSEDEIQRMVRDAEMHREEDKKFHELVGARNKADALIHGAGSAITEHGGKVPGEQIGRVESALSDLESAMKGDDQGADRGQDPRPGRSRTVAVGGGFGRCGWTAGRGRGTAGRCGGCRVHRGQGQQVSGCLPVRSAGGPPARVRLAECGRSTRAASVLG